MFIAKLFLRLLSIFTYLLSRALSTAADTTAAAATGMPNVGA
jgi:hypothetical protein